MHQGTVQAISSMLRSQDAVPPEFVRTADEQPGATTYRGVQPPAIPVVDLAAMDHAQAVDAIAAAARDWGMFQLVNHGIPAEVVAHLQRVGREFFELPPEKKEVRLQDPKSGSIEGYGTQISKDLNGKKAWGDFLFHIVWPPSRINHDYWPRQPSSYREANEDYTKHLVGVIDKIMESLSLGLGLDKGAIKEGLGGEDMVLMQKINYYPPCPQPELVLGVVAHTDMSGITILLPNDVPGLQVFNDDVGWFEVDYISGALIIHIGDQIEILSNGKYKGVLHRVTVNKEKVRLSWPVFCEPPADKVVGPLPQLVTDESPAKFKTKKFKDYQYCKLNKLPQ
ncbi:flavonol synthase/flavanone 3-hydroxylase-like [Canna indica]|uniref:Flavonol synthase/flavanone 3-hydroxylase-like n=1 Tax=Canna indica TaxID=4628 RepID=A0AAQ3QEM6_9LILI|nr:flavonol synthase/flavanone 3-hydroxylase-like [Canna indica]